MAVGGPAAVGVFLNIVTRIDLIHLIRQITGDGFHHVAERHQPFHRTKLINDKREVGARVAELLQRGEQRQRFREDQRLAHQRPQVERLAVELLLQEVNHVYHAQQLFFLFTAGHDHAGVLVFIQQGADLLFRRRQVNMLNVMAGGHDTAHRALVEVKHALYHPAFLRVEDLPVAVVGKHRRGFSIQLGILFFAAQQAHHRICGALS